MDDDRVCMHYVVDRLEDIETADCVAKISRLEAMEYLLSEFKKELIYNLGANQRIFHKENWLPDEFKS